jgi:DNA-binding transcriptional regulator YhcF (GntR family)
LSGSRGLFQKELAMNKIQPEQGSSKSTRPEPKKIPNGWAPVPASLIQDPEISDSAFRLWCFLEQSQGKHGQSQFKVETIAAKMGKSVSTIGRASKELTAAGFLEIVRTRGASFYKITHPDLIKKGHKRPTRSVINDRYIYQKVSNEINTSKQVPALTTEGLKVSAAAAQIVELDKAFSSTDPLEVLAYTEALPKYLQPKRNKLVPQHVHEAIRHGWTAIELAKAVEKAGNYQTATNPPGLAIIKLGELAAMSPSEWNTDRKPQRYDPINECKHGVLKIYGGCESCHEIRQASSRKVSA